MNAGQRIEQALAAALDLPEAAATPPLLRRAMHHAVFPGGARLRPRLTLATAAACGRPDSDLALAAATAIELLHCASLVHDDMPCFDNAALRRGRPSVHAQFGEALALLAGDGLIVLAFEVIARAAARPGQGQRGAQVLAIIAQAVGPGEGIVAGQAWECEAAVDVAHYHRAKTGALFAGAAAAGAAAAGAEPQRWRALGERLGEAYQIADDLADALGEARVTGKPAGQDAALGRPNAVRELGVAGALARLQALTEAAIAAIPDCAGREELEAIIRGQARRLLPAHLGAPALQDSQVA
ncbi:MAG: polyprenyl synthetase family protein [Rhodovarius sp.]|nr:polyprenyl synthetase family protein [Rhodovarius sp.]